MKRFVLALFALSLFAGQAQAADAKAWLKTQVTAVRALLKTPVKAGTPEAAATDAKLMALIDPVMDFDGLSQRALRKHWPSLTPAQKTEFTNTFRQLVFRSYLDRVRSANENYSIVYEDVEKVGKATEVSAIAKTKSAEIELVFALVPNGADWKTHDVRIDEVSLVENYREQFNRIIAKEQFVGLIKKMKTKLDKLGGPVKIAPKAAAAPASAAPASK
jgi:phospholipid transport system substrate-binding protein